MRDMCGLRHKRSGERKAKVLHSSGGEVEHMADFAIRVELRGNPSFETYEKLHALMANKGFMQTVSGVDLQGNHNTFNLPHAVYYGSSLDSCSAVAESVAQAVKAQIQKDIMVFAVKAETWVLR
jgi:hypothetical protein